MYQSFFFINKDPSSDSSSFSSSIPPSVLFLGQLLRLLCQHLLDFRLLVARKQVVRWVHIRVALLVVFDLMCSQVLVPVLDLYGENLVPFLQLLSIQLIIFWEIYVHETRQSMPISSNPHITVLIMVLVDHLLSNSSVCVSVAYHCISTCSLKVFLGLLCLLPVKLLLFCLRLHLFLVLVILIFLPDLVSVLLLKLQILSHDLVHVIIIDVHVHYLLALLQSVILFMKVQLFTQLFLQSFPVLRFVPFHPVCKVQ
jgi:hypothetical protein